MNSPLDPTTGPSCERGSRLAFICSAGHSGSTLLDLLIGAQPDTCSLGELILLPLEARLNRPCTCGRPVLSCPLWSQVLSRHLGCGPDALPGAVQRLNLGWMPTAVPVAGINDGRYPQLRAASHLTRWLELQAGLAVPRFSGSTYRQGLASTLEVYGHVRQVTGCTLLANSSKHYLLAVDNYLAMQGRAKIINLVRDGRAVFGSFLRHGFDAGFAIRAWKNHYARALPLFERWVRPDDLIRVRYEDLAADPTREMQRLMAALGQPFEASRVALGVGEHHNVNGNDMRFRKDAAIRLDERWRRELSAEQLRFFDRHAGGMNRAFGYTD